MNEGLKVYVAIRHDCHYLDPANSHMDTLIVPDTTANITYAISSQIRQATRPPFCYQSKQGVFFLSFLLK